MAKAYISVLGDPPVEGANNRFVVDGGISHRIFEGPNFYAFSSGSHKVTISSGDGEQWEINVNVPADTCLTIKLTLSGSNICNVQYKMDPVHPFMAWGASRL